MIHPDSKFLIYWNLTILFASIYIAIEIPLVLVFNITETLLLEIINTVSTVIFLIDVVINFNISVYQKGKIISDRRYVASKYLKGWFFVDFLAAFPFSIFLQSMRLITLGRLLRLFRLSRLLKLIRITGVFQKTGSSRINPAILRLFILVFWVLLFAHFVACGWIAVAHQDADLDPVSQYMRAFYWTVTTLTTIGYGDITPRGNIQIVYTILIELAGAAMYGLVIGNIANLIANIDIAKTQFKERMKNINTFLKYRDIPMSLQQKVNKYYNYLWDSRRGYNEAEIIADLPLPLKTSIALFINKDIIEKVPIFKGASDELKKEIILNLQPVVFSPGDNVVTAGEVGNDMYFLSRGSVDVLSKDEKMHFATLNEGQFFGEITLLLQTPRTATIKAREFCDLFRLDKETFDRILTRYPDFEAYIRKMAEDRKKETEGLKASENDREPEIPARKAPPVMEERIPLKEVKNFKAKLIDNKVQLEWQPIENAEYYEIITKFKTEKDWRYVVKELKDTAYTDTPEKKENRLLYRVRGMNEAGPGPWSEIRSVEWGKR